MSDVVRVAMWSGPRNISTAMMRAFENRADTVVVDEPLYAAYLSRTGLRHPAFAEVISSQPTGLTDAVAALYAPLPSGRRVHYAKHMAHHVSRDMDMGWTLGFRNVLLIRDPVEVVASYVRARETCEPDDIGLAQQRWLLGLWDDEQLEVPILGAREFLGAPEAHLCWLCDWLEIPFTTRMLSAPGPPRVRRGLGTALVRVGLGVDRIRAVARAGDEPFRPRRRRRRGVPSDLRGAVRAAGAGVRRGRSGPADLERRGVAAARCAAVGPVECSGFSHGNED
ncbi:MAG TPA: hypothetical protein VGF81_12610 [Solirubrobacteraceae bacterium]